MNPENFSNTFTLFFDGCSMKNPGPSGIAFIILDHNGNTVEEKWAYIGEATNNVAEYRALVSGLKRIKERGINRIIIKTDSLLIVNQILGNYRVKSPKIIPLFKEVKEILKGLQWEIKKVERSETKKVDQLAFISAKSKK